MISNEVKEWLVEDMKYRRGNFNQDEPQNKWFSRVINELEEVEE